MPTTVEAIITDVRAAMPRIVVAEPDLWSENPDMAEVDKVSGDMFAEAFLSKLRREISRREGPLDGIEHLTTLIDREVFNEGAFADTKPIIETRIFGLDVKLAEFPAEGSHPDKLKYVRDAIADAIDRLPRPRLSQKDLAAIVAADLRLSHLTVPPAPIKPNLEAQTDAAIAEPEDRIREVKPPADHATTRPRTPEGVRFRMFDLLIKAGVSDSSLGAAMGITRVHYNRIKNGVAPWPGLTATQRDNVFDLIESRNRLLIEVSGMLDMPEIRNPSPKETAK